MKGTKDSEGRQHVEYMDEGERRDCHKRVRDSFNGMLRKMTVWRVALELAFEDPEVSAP